MIHKYDIVIYGTGPGSLFFLEKFYNKKVSVAIIDSGGFDEIADEKIIDKVTGPIKFYNNSNKEKGDGFFGTCKYWLQKGVGGKLQKFDPTDFEENNWPFDYKKIDKYYNLALKIILQNTGLNLQNDFVVRSLPKELKSLEDNFNLKADSSTLSYNFRLLYQSIKKKFLNSKNFFYFPNTKLIKFKMNHAEEKVDFSYCKNKKGEIIKFFTNHHILSCGCLENNRIILNTFNDKPDYLKDKNVGRYISFHPSINFGNYDLKNKIRLKDINKKYNTGKKIIFLKSQNEKNFNSALNLSYSLYRGKNFLINKTILKFLNYIKKIEFSLLIEHKPSFSSKITLSENMLLKEVPKINIHSEITEDNLLMIEKSKKKYKDIISKIKILDQHSFNFTNLDINCDTDNHHHGGLLFGKKKEFPVNEDFTLKDFNNLYINGSSLFPSSSIYGPTFTIIACSVMLSEIIDNKIIDKNY